MLPILTAMSSILVAITKVAITIGPAIAKYAPILLDVAAKYLPQIIKTVEAVCTILNIISPNESAEDLGAKAMCADKKPEDFDKTNEYIHYLKNDVSVDSSTLSTDKVDVIARQVIGTSILIKGVNETLSVEVSLPFIKAVSQLGVDAKVIIEVVKAYSESGLKLEDYAKYVTKTLPIEQLDKHSEVLVNAYQKADSSLSEEQAENSVVDLSLPKNSG